MHLLYEFRYDPNEPIQFNAIFLSSFQRNIVAPVRPQGMNKRLMPQNGLFLAQGNINISFEDNLAAMNKVSLDEDNRMLKFTLPGKFRLEILERLDRMGIRQASLFPCLDGFVEGQATKLELDYFRAESTTWEEKHRPSKSITGYNSEESKWNFRVGKVTGTNPYD